MLIYLPSYIALLQYLHNRLNLLYDTHKDTSTCYTQCFLYYIITILILESFYSHLRMNPHWKLLSSVDFEAEGDLLGLIQICVVCIGSFYFYSLLHIMYLFLCTIRLIINLNVFNK